MDRRGCVGACENDFVLRDRTNYNEQIALLARIGPAAESETGIRSECILNTLKSFHAAENRNGDLFHDFLEGVGPYETKLVLSHLVNDKYVTLEQINRRITNTAPSTSSSVTSDSVRSSPKIRASTPLQSPQSASSAGSNLTSPIGEQQFDPEVGANEELAEPRDVESDDEGPNEYMFSPEEALNIKAVLREISPDLAVKLAKLNDPKISNQEFTALRRSLVRNVMNYYTAKTPELKQLELARIAFSLTINFPTLKDSSTKLGYEHFFSPHSKSGYVKSFYYNHRHSHPGIRTRPYKRALLASDGDQEESESKLSADDYETMRYELSNLLPTTMASKLEIAQKMKQTRVARVEHVMKHQPTITKVLEDWPRLGDCLTELERDAQSILEMEFKLPDNFDCSQQFERAAKIVVKEAFGSPCHTQKVMFQAFEVDQEAKIEQLSTEDLCALAILNLAYLIAGKGTMVYRKTNKKADNIPPPLATRHLIQYVPNDAKSVASHVQDLKKADSEFRQPFLVAVTIDGRPEAADPEDPATLYLVLDHQPIRVGRSFSRALGLVLMSHFAFKFKFKFKIYWHHYTLLHYRERKTGTSERQKN